MQRDQAHRTNELLERIAKALEKKKVKKEASKISKEVLDTVKTITDDYVVYNGKLKPVKDIPGFEGTLDALDNLTNLNKEAETTPKAIKKLSPSLFTPLTLLNCNARFPVCEF